MKSRLRTSHRTEHGGVMLLLALLIVPIVMMLALSIDTTRVSTSLSQLERAADYMSLAALETFLNDDDDAYSERKSKALQRVLNIGQFEANALLGGSEGKLLESAGDIGPGQIADVQFGKWWFEEPVGGCSQDTDDPERCCVDGLFKPCFIERDASQLEEINAVSLTLQSRESQSGGLNYVFGQSFQEAPRLKTTSIAATIPRNGVFLLDLSRSTQVETHLPYAGLSNENKCYASEYAFRLAPGVVCNAGVADCTVYCNNTGGATFFDECMNYCATLEAPRPPPLVAPPPATDREPQFQFMRFPQTQETWNLMRDTSADPVPAGCVRPAGAPASIDHYKEDYQCITFPFGPGPGDDEHYMIEVRQDADYRGPEPLTSIIEGVHEAAVELSRRTITGDRIAFLAFDNSVLPETMPNPTTPYRRFGPYRKGSAEFENLKQITDVSDPGQIIPRLDRYLIPASGPNRGQTNISRALVEAKRMLLGLDNFSSARNFVALFSDGMSSCYNYRNGSPCMYVGEAYADRITCLAPSPSNILPGSNSSGQVHAMGIQEAAHILSRNLTGEFWYRPELYRDRHQLPPHTCGGGGSQNSRVPSYVDLRIQFHYFPIGDEVTPFSLVQVNRDGDGCKTEEERHLEEFTVGNLSNNNGAGLFAESAGFDCSLPENSGRAQCTWQCNQANDKYCLKRKASTDPRISYINQHLYLYSLGTHKTKGLLAPVRPPCASSFDLDAQCNGKAPNSHVSIPGVTVPSPNGAYQLLTCDPQGRTKAEQIKDYVRKIYDDTPFLLVQ